MHFFSQHSAPFAQTSRQMEGILWKKVADAGDSDRNGGRNGAGGCIAVAAVFLP